MFLSYAEADEDLAIALSSKLEGKAVTSSPSMEAEPLGRTFKCCLHQVLFYVVSPMERHLISTTFYGLYFLTRTQIHVTLRLVKQIESSSLPIFNLVSRSKSWG